MAFSNAPPRPSPTAPTSAGVKFLARGLGEVLQRIYPRSAPRQLVRLADRPVRREIRVHRHAHDLLGARDGPRRAGHAHPADRGVEGDELLDPRLVTDD